MADTWAWIDADGASWPMNGFAQALEVVDGVTGRGLPPIRTTREIVAGLDGQRLRQVKHDMSVITVPVLVQAATLAAKQTAIRAWARHLDPDRGPGILRVVGPLGDARRLTCIYAGGFELDESGDNATAGTQGAKLSFQADDPHWYDEAATSFGISSSSSTAKWFTPAASAKRLLPIQLGASAVLGAVTVTLDTDVAVYPIWTITGPGSNLVLRNNTTGDELIWNGTLAGGDILVIDTRPGFKTVQKNGVNAFASLTSWNMWPLIAGDNDLDVALSGATSASGIVGSVTAAHLTA